MLISWLGHNLRTEADRNEVLVVDQIFRRWVTAKETQRKHPRLRLTLRADRTLHCKVVERDELALPALRSLRHLQLHQQMLEELVRQ